MERLNDRSFYAAMDTSQGLCLVLVTGAGCGACRSVKQLIPAVCEQLPGLRVVEVDAGNSPGVASDLEVFHLPGMFLWRDGDFHAPIHAQARPDHLVAAIRAAADGPAHPEP